MTDVTTYLSPGGQQHTSGGGPATRIRVGTIEGVATLRRDSPASPWKLVGRTLADRHVGQLVHEPVSGKLFAGCHAGGGLWVSDDGEGESWRQLTKGLDKPHIYALAARNNGGKVTLFAGTSPPALYRSDDLGESWKINTGIYKVADTEHWTFPPPPHVAHVKQIAFHPTEPETFYVLVEQGAFLKTVDDGKTFRDLTGYSHPDDANYRDPHRLLIDPADPDVFYLASGVGIYRSDDGGETYEHLMRRGDRIGYADFVFLDPSDRSTVYQGGSPLNPRDWYEHGMARSCVMRSTDKGRTWMELDNGMPNPMIGAIQAMTQHVWDGGMMLLVGTATGEVYASENGGASWERISENVAPVAKDNHHIPFMTEEERQQPRAHMGM